MRKITIEEKSKGSYLINGLIIHAMNVQAALQIYVSRTMSGATIMLAGDR